MIGRRLSHYRIAEKLGEGGMGTVYRAEDLDRGRQVALKVLRAEILGGAAGRERLRREARACVGLRHPNITEVHEVGEAEEFSFIVMELVEGDTLRALLREGPFSWDRLAAIGSQAASALARAHRQGLVHRDIKPENIMVTRSGRVKVLDFGLARGLAPDAEGEPDERVTQVGRLTRPGAVLGTLEYLSPEQAQGREAGPASDTFSLGVVLYELATGVLPFPGTSVPERIHAIVYDQPEPVHALRADAPPELERILERALQKRIERRYPDGSRMEADLRKFSETGPAAGRPMPEPATATVPVRTAVAATRLVGRRSELDLLREMLRSASAGSGRAAWVAGEAGCGKSRLVQELAADAERKGCLVLQGECPVREGVRPYHPFVEAFAGYLARAGVQDPGGLRAHLETLEPGLGLQDGILAGLLQMDLTGAARPLNRQHVLDAASALLVALSRNRPVLMILDDLHWADPESLELLQGLVRTLSRMRVLLVGTFRPEDLGAEPGAIHPLARLLDRAEREVPGARLSLRRLDRAETAELVEEALGSARLDARFLDRLFLRTEGNPLFLLELLQMLRAEGALPHPGEPVPPGREELTALPGKVRDIVERRLRHLEPTQRGILEAAAVAGATFRSGTLEACLGVDRLALLTQLQLLEREMHLIHSDEDSYRFDHAVIREALLEGMIPELRREYHRRVGRYLRDRLGDRPEHAAAIAYQLLEAREESAAVPFLLTAAAAAAHVFSNEQAIEHLTRASRILRSKPDPGMMPAAMRIREERGELLQLVGRYDEARRDFEALQALAADENDGAREAVAHTRLGELLGLQGDHEGALRSVARAREAASRAGDERALAGAAAVAGQVHFHRGDFEAALADHAIALDHHKAEGERAGVAHALNKIGNIRYYRGEYDAALGAYEAALGMERELGDRRGIAESLMNLGATHLQLGDAVASLEHHRAALQIKREIGDRRSMAMSLNNLALTFEALGRLDEARGQHEESLIIKREIGDPRGISTSLSNLAAIYEKMGQFERSLQCARESLTLKREIRDQMSLPYALNAVGAMLLAVGRTDEAESHHREALELTREIGDRTEEAGSLRRLGEVRLERGEPGPACGPLMESLAVAREVGVREGEMEAGYSLGLAQVAAGRLDAAAGTLAQLADASGSEAPEYRAKREHLAARIAAAQGNTEEALRYLHSALDAAAEVGLTDLQWRLHADLSQVYPGGAGSPEAREDRARARLILEEVASRIHDPDLRSGFLSRPAAVSLRTEP